MQTMTTDEIRAFLIEQPHTAKLATVCDDGRPHITPIWFALDDEAEDETIVFTTWYTTIKAANIRRDSRVCLCIDDEQPPFSYVMIEGTATFSDDTEELVHWATRIGGRYMGAEQAEDYGRRNGVPGELLVRITPTRIVAQKDIALE